MNRTSRRSSLSCSCGTGSRHLVPKERCAGIRRLARSPDGARKGPIGASARRSAGAPGLVQAVKAAKRPAKETLDFEQLRGRGLALGSVA